MQKRKQRKDGKIPIYEYWPHGSIEIWIDPDELDAYMEKHGKDMKRMKEIRQRRRAEEVRKGKGRTKSKSDKDKNKNK